MADIDLDKSMAELIDEVPAVGAVLAQLGIACSDCIASGVDKLPDVVRMYNLDMQDILQKIEREMDL